MTGVTICREEGLYGSVLAAITAMAIFVIAVFMSAAATVGIRALIAVTGRSTAGIRNIILQWDR
jgi:hypothetical protein